MFVFSAFLAVLMAAAHCVVVYLRFVHMTPRSRWLSFASGVSVAFVFLKLLPHLYDAHHEMRDEAMVLAAYFLSLGGLVAFYGLEVAVRQSRRAPQHGSEAGRGIFLVHLGGFAIYNALLGAMIADQMEQTIPQQLVFVAALMLHNMVNDFAMREHHKSEYERYGRWVLGASVLVGWGAAVLVTVPAIGFFAVVSVLTGAIILNVLKDELPPEMESRFDSFLLGCVMFSVLWVLSGP